MIASSATHNLCWLCCRQIFSVCTRVHRKGKFPPWTTPFYKSSILFAKPLAHLKNLRRTKSGRFTLEHAVTVDELKNGDPAVVAQKILSLPAVSRMRGA